jgi:tRNA 2-thiouridine synthesizing protein A
LADDVLDARGLKCPLPVLKLEKRLAAMPAGARLTVLASDPVAKIDIPLYCTQHGHVCKATANEDDLVFEIVTARTAS